MTEGSEEKLEDIKKSNKFNSLKKYTKMSLQCNLVSLQEFPLKSIRKAIKMLGEVN